MKNIEIKITYIIIEWLNGKGYLIKENSDPDIATIHLMAP